MKKIKFTIIEDNDSARLVLKHLLLKCFYCTVDEAENGKIGLDMLTANAPDIVFLDIAMPEMDGLSLLSRMRKIPNLEKLPVIITSAIAHENLIKNSVNLGIETYLVKPLDSNIVLQRIGTLVEKLGGKKKIEFLLNDA